MIAKKKNSRRLTYRITDRASCESAIRFAAVLWAIPAVTGLLVAPLDILRSGSEPERGLAALLDLWPLALFGFIGVLALRLYHHKSRVASTLLFAIFVVPVLISYVLHGFAAAGPGVAFQLLLGFIYFRGMQGTYLWHSTYRDAPPTIESQDTEDDEGAPGQDEQEPLARSCDDLCPKCFEYFEVDELICRYCGSDLRHRSSLARG